MHKVIEERVVDGFSFFCLCECVCLFDVSNGVEGVCGVLCVSNVQRQWGSQTFSFVRMMVF
jgi:hypothetical protein